MYKKIISHLLILSFLLTGCYSWEIVQEPDPNSTIRVTTKNQKVYEMSEWEDSNEQIIGDAGETKRQGRFTTKLQTRINKKDVNKYEVQKLDELNTIILIIGLSAAIVGIIILDNSSFGAPFSN